MRFIPTQAERLLGVIRTQGRQGMSYGELNGLGISVCAWRRLSPDEKPERFLRKGERLERFEDAEGRVRIRIRRAA